MLLGRITPNGTGITILGDYHDLDSLYQTIHELSNGLQDDTGIYGLLMGLAYEIRHTKQNDREFENFEIGHDEKFRYKSTNLFLATFLPTLSLLRHRCSVINTSEAIQADIYALERLTKDALLAADTGAGLELYEWIRSFPFFTEKYIEQISDLAVLNICNIPAKKRFKETHRTLFNHFIRGPFYNNIITNLQNSAEANKCDILELEIVRPEKFKW